MKKAGHELSNNLCPHITMSRAELFNVVKCVFRSVPIHTSFNKMEYYPGLRN